MLASKGGITKCEQATVKKRGRRQYDTVYEDFRAWCVKHRRPPLAENAALEISLLDYIDTLMKAKRPGTDGQKVVAAVRSRFPNLSRAGQGTQPRVKKAIAGFLKAMPPASRLPLPEEEMAAIAATLIYMEAPHDVVMNVVTSFYGYLRPSDAENLRAADVTPPAGGNNPGLQHHTLNLAAFEWGTPSKTATYDDSFVLDQPDFLGPLLHKMAKKLPRSSPLFKTSNDLVVEWFRIAVKRLRLPATVRYQLRHGGASEDMLARRRQPAEIQSRGRWRSVQSVQRYCKPALVQKYLSMVPEATRKHGQWALPRLAQLLNGTIKPRAPPA